MTTTINPSRVGFDRSVFEQFLASRVEPEWITDARRSAYEIYEAKLANELCAFGKRHGAGECCQLVAQLCARIHQLFLFANFLLILEDAFQRRCLAASITTTSTITFRLNLTDGVGRRLHHARGCSRFHKVTIS